MKQDLRVIRNHSEQVLLWIPLRDFHLLLEIHSQNQTKQHIKSNTSWNAECGIPEKQGVYQIEAEKEALDMTHPFPYLRVKDTELLQKNQNVKRFEEMAWVKQNPKHSESEDNTKNWR